MTLYQITAGIVSKGGNYIKTKPFPKFILSDMDHPIKGVDCAYRLAKRIINDKRYSILVRNIKTGEIKNKTN
jgi:hypothetical protein